MSQQIERIPLPDRETFFRDYVHARRPVVITDLFSGCPIREITTLEDASRAFGKTRCAIINELHYAFVSRDPGQTVMTFDEYWAHVRRDPSTRLHCHVQDIPARVMTLFSLPRICLASDVRGTEVLGMPRRYGDHDLVAQAFFANKGNKAHLHYDGDQRQVFLYQVFGRKEVVLFHPETAARLPRVPGSVIFLDVWLDRMSESERCELVEEHGGYRTTLYPGEAIYIPMLMWHHVGYTDDAMSFNLRFGRNRYGRFLCVDNFHRDYLIQNFASRLSDECRAEHRCGSALRSIIEEYGRSAESLEAKVRSVRSLFRQLCSELIPEARVEEVCPPQEDDQQVQAILADIGGTARYLSAESIARSRPTGLITPAQRRGIEEQAGRCGYSAETLRRILYNRLGKQELYTLSKAEAVVMLAYLTAPGAVW